MIDSGLRRGVTVQTVAFVELQLYTCNHKPETNQAP